jgi:hypothetical protein
MYYYLLSSSKKTALLWRGWFSLILLLSATCAQFGFSANGAEKKRSSMLQEDFPFQGACIEATFPRKNIAMKGLAIRTGPNATMLFDTELLRMAAGWTGDYITTHGVAFDGAHGSHPKIDGDQKFGTRQAPGWADASGSFADPRHEPFGPLPSDWCRYDGLHVVGMNVVLSYTVLGTKIHEQPSSVFVEGQVGFVRTFEIAKAKADLATVVAETESGTAEVKGLTGMIIAGTNLTSVGLVGAPSGVRLEAGEKSILLKIPKARTITRNALQPCSRANRRWLPMPKGACLAGPIQS